MKPVIVLAVVLVAAACGEESAKEPDFRAFGSAAAERRSSEFGLCNASTDGMGRQALIRCMERRGYSYQPR